ncbi:hypothetical protein PILCRDRAFT_525261 [Piloderma croceum F 1598]|uniref:Uncharacterized protein n=1 Tax=Piloderma croceum (strain F 1598) TaxID=765440 RepID=A0A0C3FMD9_PILCF|nr:hypothetical protein PILCRDRAFT_525261 [Piloderma croceum F 1598]
MFDRMTGNKMVELKVAEQGMVQTVATHSRERVHTIVAATLNMRAPSVIKIWVYEATHPSFRIPPSLHSLHHHFAYHFDLILMIFCGIQIGPCD